MTGGVCSLLFVAIVNGGAAFGYVKRQSVIRWIAVALTSITGITCFGCGIFAVIGPAILAENLPPDVELEQGQMLIEGIVMILASIVRFALLTCLLLRPTSEWFDS